MTSRIHLHELRRLFAQRQKGLGAIAVFTLSQWWHLHAIRIEVRDAELPKLRGEDAVIDLVRDDHEFDI